MTDTLLSARAALDAGTTTSRALTEAALARIADPAGEGGRTMRTVYRDAALAAADAFDARRKAGVRALSALDGLPISVKDLFDVAGEPTTTGTKILANAPPAVADARIVARLRRAGAVVIGKTNQSEFAYTGIGYNPHHGTPRNAWDRAAGSGAGRMPGGSSSGAAVSVTDGFCVGAIGTDTGGSVRIPAALNGLVGYKPTAARVSREGCFPLSTQLDSIGPLAATVADCVALDRVLAGLEPEEPAAVPCAPDTVNLFVPTNTVFDGADAHVARAFDRAIGRLVDAGVRVRTGRLPGIDVLREIMAHGGFSATESWAALGALVTRERAHVDPYVFGRMERGATVTAADWIAMTTLRARMIRETWAAVPGVTALAMPTCPLVARPLDELLADPAHFAATNLLTLRNTSIGNHLDACAVTIPCHPPGSGPAGFMLVAPHGADEALQAAALALEPVIRRA